MKTETGSYKNGNQYKFRLLGSYIIFWKKVVVESF